MAFLLALALVVSVMSGLGLSVSAEQESNTPGTEEVQQQDKTEAGAAPSEVKAEEEAAKPEEKPVQEEKADEQKTEAKENADKPAEKQEKATPKAGENVQTATIGTGDKTVTVKTTAAAGVLPEGAKLVVKKLANQDQAYQDAESTLKDSQVTYDDFLALDVGFEVNGKEVEPEAGSVQVQFELGAGLLPETADTSTLAVQHLTDGKAETVADAGAVTAGDVTVKNEVVKADFEVQSFSSFTITWSRFIKVTVFYVDEYGNDISATQDDVQIDDEHMEPINLRKYAKNITGYNYSGARYAKYDGKVITDLKPGMEKKPGFFLEYTVRTIQFLNNGTEVANVSTSDRDTTATIYLVYKEDENSGGGTGGVVTKPTPSYSKQAILKGDGTYDLSLTVSSNIGSASNPAKVDVIYVLDVSGSMKDQIDGQTKRDAANNAIRSMTNSLANDKLINARFSLVTFSGDNYYPDEAYNDARPLVQWTSNAGTLNNSLPKSSDGGTNYEAGLREAKVLLENARKGATTVVIFISDGNPGFYYDKNGYTDGTGNPDNLYDGYNKTAMSHAQAQVKELAATYFFKVGVGDSKKYSRLDMLTQEGVHAGTETKPVFEGTDTDALNKAFEKMRGAITSISCKEVNITDTLQSNHAQIVKDAEGNPTALQIVVKDGNGAIKGKGKGSVTLPATTNNKAEVSTINAEYVDTSKQIKLNFNPAYQLEENWTYEVIANIEPTAQAYEDYCNSKGYPTGEVGDAATGTHEREAGFYCNEDAVLSYHDGESSKTAHYAKPVIQVKPGTLKITKSISGLDEDQIAALKDKMTFTIARAGKEEPQTVKLSEFKPGTDGTYTYEMPYCVPGATYTVNESKMNVEGFDCATKVNNTDSTSGSATIEKGKTKTIAFTNVYTLSAKNLTIEKKVDGQKPENLSAEFSFKIEGPENANGDYTITGKTEKVTFTNGKANITINGESSITIEKLPLGTYTVTETSMGNVDHYTWTTLENAKTGDATLLAGQDGTVTITNTLKKNPKVTVKKEVTGNMSQKSDSFGFNVNGTSTTLTAEDDAKYEVEVAYGSKFTVTETDKNGYELDKIEAKGSTGSQSSDSYTIDSVTADTEITFTNTKTIQPPNGIITTIAPYAIMVVLAAGAGVYFVYSRRRRNR